MGFPREKLKLTMINIFLRNNISSITIKIILNRNIEAEDVVIMIDRLQVLHLLLTQIMIHRKPNELDRKVVPEAVLEAALQNASQEAEHQSAVHAAVAVAEVEIVEIEVGQEKNPLIDQDVQDQDLGQDRKKNEKHQPKT